MSNFSIAVPSNVYSCVLTASATGVSAWSSGVLTVASANQSANTALLPLNNLYPQSSRIVGISGGNANAKYRVSVGAVSPASVATPYAPALTITSTNSAEATSPLTIYWVNEVASSPNFGGDVSSGVASAPVAVQPC